MISPDYVLTMARYNRWQNRSLYAAAGGLTAGAREEDRGAFFGSIRGTFSHLLWGDTIWMSRFDGWSPPDVGIPSSAAWESDWDRLASARRDADDRIIEWAGEVSEDELAGKLAWFSGALGRDVERPMALCVMHFFNHQTHHRGQVHAMLTAAGAKPEDTDLFIMPDDA